MAWFLETLRSPDSLAGSTFPLRRDRNLAGRDAGCDLVVADPHVSSLHCLIDVSGVRVQVADLRSTNGTFLDGVRIRKADWLPGQTLRLGATEFRLAWKPGAGESLPRASLNDGDFEFSVVSERGIPAGEPGSRTEGGEAERVELLTRRLDALRESVRALAGAPSVPELLDRMMRLLFGALHCETGYMLVTDPGAETVRAHLAYERGRRRENLEEKLYSRALVRRALESKTGFIFDSEEPGSAPAAAPSQSLYQLRIRTALCCPLHSGDRVFGVVYLEGKMRGRKFTPDDLDLVMNVAGIAGTAIENVELYRRLRSEVRIREHLRRFVSPNVAEQIIAERGGGDFHLVSRRMPLSVLFADIRGFTPLAESLPPLAVVRALNAHFSRMSAVVFRNGGTLDKFIGDGMMVLFNAPFARPDHEIAAVKTAVEMREELRRILPELREQGLPDLRMGIGIHSGEAVAGSIGTEARMEYTAIGDVVNTAARVCGLAKADQILVTASVHARVKEAFRTEEQGSVLLKGKSRDVLLYEVEPRDSGPPSPRKAGSGTASASGPAAPGT